LSFLFQAIGWRNWHVPVAVALGVGAAFIILPRQGSRPLSKAAAWEGVLTGIGAGIGAGIGQGVID